MSLQQPPHPIFLISVPRSGTNLFMHLFSEHPQIVQKDYSFFNAYLYGPENQRGKEVIESSNPSGILVGGPLLEETFQKAYNRLESSIASIVQDQSSPKTILFKDHTTMLLKTSVMRSEKPDWASRSPKVAKAIECVASSNTALLSSLPSPRGAMRNPTYLPDEFLGLFSPVVLIRHPAITVPSLYGAMLRQQEAPEGNQLYEWEYHGSQTSPITQWGLWQWYNERADLAEAGTSQKAENGTEEHLNGANGAVSSHLRPIVLDTDLDLLSQPAETIKYLTQRLSIDPAGMIQSWSPTASASDHPGLTAFKGTLLNSAGLMPPKTVSNDIRGIEAKKWEAEWGKDVSEALMNWVDQHLGLYEKLKGKRTRIAEP